MGRLLVLLLITILAATGCSKSNDVTPAGTVTNPSKPEAPVGTDIGSTENDDQTDNSGNDDQTDDGTTIIVNDDNDGSGTGSTDEGDEIDFTEIGPNDPCYDYMNHRAAKPVANCIKMENGRLGNNYPSIVKFGRACLLQSEHDNGITIYTVTGSFIELDNDWNRVVHRLDGFKDTKIQDDRVSFSFKDDKLKTTVAYDITEETLRVKQVTKTFKKKVRHFKLGCTPVHSIR